MIYLGTLLNCACPPATAIGDIADDTCRTGFGPEHRFIFQRLNSAVGVPNTMTAANSLLEATWTTLHSASDGTKAQSAPLVDNPVSDGGARVTYGGGDTTRDRIALTIGADPTTRTYDLLNVSQSVITELKAFACDAESGNLGVYFVNASGQIQADLIAADDIRPIKVSSAFVQDLIKGTNTAPDMNKMVLEFAENWSDRLTTIDVDFGLTFSN